MSSPQPTVPLPQPLQRPPYSRSLFFAGAAYALEAMICAGGLMAVYQWLRAEGQIWALVSALVVLQPGVQQSFEASAYRIFANLIGASAGFLCGWLLGVDVWHVVVGILITVAICLAFRLEQSLRTACVSVVIVMTTSDGHVATTGIKRCIGVVIGSLLAVSVQLTVEAVARRMRAYLDHDRPTGPSE